jgi:site-specific DNA recombinase
VVAVYKDLQSAWSDKQRPDFERMLRDAESGAFDVVLVWKFDRMARSVLTFERAVRGLTGCGVQFASLSESVETTTPMGTFTLHLAGALAQLESDTISYRVRAANRHLASKGRVASGGRRCFGYNRDGSVNLEEAGLLREAARRFLDGATLTAVVKGWNAQGIRTPSGNEWGPSVLGRLLRAERIAGMRRHGEHVFTGDWEPIIDRGTFYALAEALEDSKRRTVRRGIKRHLLTGIARCSLCGQGMGTRVPKASQGVRYACVNAPGRKGCGRVTIVARQLEDVVERIVLRSPLLSQCASDEAALSEAR